MAEITDGIVLKYFSNEEKTHSGVDFLELNKLGGGVQIFSKGESVGDVTVDLNLKDGDQTVSAGEDKLMKTVVITKPEGLHANNIAKGVNIAGVVGEYEGGSGDFDSSDENLKYFSYQLDAKTKKVVLMADLYYLRNAETGSYNVHVPAYAGGYRTIVNEWNVNGFFASQYSSSNYKSVTFDNDVLFSDNTMRQTFYYCYGLKNASIPHTVVKLEGTFKWCNGFNQNITIPNSVVVMCNTFMGCNSFNQNITIPSSVIDITYIFSGCNNFNQNITIPNSVVNMFGAFWSCNNFNQNIMIPNSVTDLSRAFARCANFNQNIMIPNSVTSMSGTFWASNNFNISVTIPDGVTDLSYCFQENPNFNSPIAIPNSVVDMTHIFNGCKNFNQPIQIPNGVMSIESFLSNTQFNYPVVIPNSVINMSCAFANCQNFNQPIEIPKGVQSIDNAFNNCLQFNQPITIPSTVENGVYNRGLTNMFRNCKNMGSDITILSTNINNVYCFLSGKNNSKRINIYVPPNCTTNTRFANTNRYYSAIGLATSWKTDTANKCYYNTTVNIYVYYTVGTETASE